MMTRRLVRTARRAGPRARLGRSRVTVVVWRQERLSVLAADTVRFVVSCDLLDEAAFAEVVRRVAAERGCSEIPVRVVASSGHAQ